MLDNVRQISFENKRKESQFDLVYLSNLYNRKDLIDTLFEFQQINFYMLLFFTEGKGKHTIDFTDFSFEKGTLLSIRKDQIHRFQKSKAEGYLLLFTDDFLMQFIEQSEVLKSLQLFNEFITSPKIQLEEKEYTEFLQLITDIENEYFSIKDEHYLGIIRSFLHIFFRKLFRLKSKSKEVFSKKKYLEEFIQLQALVEKQCMSIKRVSEYASQMAVSTKTLNNITNQIVHKSAKQFIDEIVITQIKRLLINTNYSIKEIAFKSGFEEPTNLYKFFKKYTQVTPELFRQSKR